VAVAVAVALEVVVSSEVLLGRVSAGGVFSTVVLPRDVVVRSGCGSEAGDVVVLGK
jgi:hypothetical protein